MSDKPRKLHVEAMENAANLAFEIFDDEGWPLGKKSAEDIAKEIINRYLEMEAYYGE